VEGGVNGDNGNGDDCGENDDKKDVLGLVLLLEDEEDEEDKGVVGLLIVNENGGSVLATYGGCGKGVIGAHRCPECSTRMHVFFGDAMGDGVS